MRSCCSTPRTAVAGARSATSAQAPWRSTKRSSASATIHISWTCTRLQLSRFRGSMRSRNAVPWKLQKEGKNAIKWTRLSCRTFAANAVRLQLHALAYNLGNFMHTLAMPKTAPPWSLTSLREKLIKIGAKVVSHGRYVTFQLAEVAVPRRLFAEILSLIDRLRAPPAPA